MSFINNQFQLPVRRLFASIIASIRVERELVYGILGSQTKEENSENAKEILTENVKEIKVKRC